MNLRFVDGDELFRLVSFRAAIDALERAFSAPAGISAPPRSHHHIGDADLLVMPSWGAEAAGVKLVSVNPSNPARDLPLINGVYVLFERASLTPVAVIDAAALTVLRTAALSALATRYLARPESSRLVVFGAGAQAGGHVRALAEVLALDHVVVVSRTRGRAEALVEELRSEGLSASVGIPDAVAEADVVCTCTTSAAPVFDGTRLAPSAHVNAIGSYRREAREIDDAVVARARIVVETRAAAQAEAGDLIGPLEAGLIAPGDLVELSEVVGGRRVRAAEGDLTLFKSVGHALEDLAVAALIA